jgi:predicted metal-dependent hydrolase
MPEPTPEPSGEVDLLGESVSYEIRRSEEATEPRIDVDIRGVRVVLPDGSSDDPETLLAENAAWVLEKKRKYETYREQVPDRQFEAGETFPYLNEPHEVTVEQRPTSDVTDGELRLAKHHVEQTSVKRALETLYRRKAREMFEDQADRYTAEMDVEYEEIEVRNQRTKWGSCSTTGTLGLNWRLMMAPPGVIDYVVVHELAHLREQNHTNKFWSLVADHDPNYEEHAEWLEENSVKLLFSHEDL